MGGCLPKSEPIAAIPNSYLTYPIHTFSFFHIHTHTHTHHPALPGRGAAHGPTTAEVREGEARRNSGRRGRGRRGGAEGQLLNYVCYVNVSRAYGPHIHFAFDIQICPHSSAAIRQRPPSSSPAHGSPLPTKLFITSSSGGEFAVAVHILTLFLTNRIITPSDKK